MLTRRLRGNGLVARASGRIAAPAPGAIGGAHGPAGSRRAYGGQAATGRLAIGGTPEEARMAGQQGQAGRGQGRVHGTPDLDYDLISAV